MLERRVGVALLPMWCCSPSSVAFLGLPWVSLLTTTCAWVIQENVEQ